MSRAPWLLPERLPLSKAKDVTIDQLPGMLGLNVNSTSPDVFFFMSLNGLSYVPQLLL